MKNIKTDGWCCSYNEGDLRRSLLKKSHEGVEETK